MGEMDFQYEGEDGEFVTMEDGEIPFDMEAAMAEFEKETEPMESLQEVIDVGTSKAFDKLTNSETATLYKLLKLVNKKTGITARYMTQLFIDISGVDSVHA